MSSTRNALIATVAASVLLTSAACTGDDDKKSSFGPSLSGPGSSASSTSKPRPHKPPRKSPRKNPFTGVGRVPRSPTISVKIDDTAPGRPQLGIERADIVYIEAVEGGLTRLAAIYGTYKPVVGWVRSTRPSDPDLLLQFGKITAAYSGGAHDALPRMHRSGLRSWSNDAGAPFYSRVGRYQSSYINLALNLRRVARNVHTRRPKNIGWTFSWSLGRLPVHPGRRVLTTVTGSYSSGTPVEFRYRPHIRKYVRYINGVPQRAHSGKLIAARNVIVQQCKVVSHFADRDVLGNPSQFTYTVGRGRVAVFRQGKRINGTWTRRHLRDGTTLRTFGGRPLTLAPGNTWVVLIRKGISTRS